MSLLMSMKPVNTKQEKNVDYYKGKETGLGALCGISSHVNETY